jgi:hypothetical protein
MITKEDSMALSRIISAMDGPELWELMSLVLCQIRPKVAVK